MKRRFLAAILAVCLTLALALTGCEKTPTETPTPTPSPTPTATPSPTPTPEPTPTPDETTTPAVEPDDVEGPVSDQGNEAFALLAGTYVVDFSPLMAPVEAEITIGGDGAFTAAADIADYYVSAAGVITEENGVFTLSLTEPAVDARIRFTYDGADLVYDESDLEGVITADYFVELMNLLFPNGLPWDLDSALESGPGHTADDKITAEPPQKTIADLLGTYLIDLTEIGLPIVISAEFTADGAISLSTVLEDAGLLVFADGQLTESGGIYTMSIPGFDEKLRFTFDGDVLVYDEEDFETLAYVPEIADIVNLILTPAEEAAVTAEVLTAVSNEPDPAAMVADIAGFYIIDLEPAGWEVSVAATIEEDGAFFAETDIFGFGGIYVDGSVTWADGTYTIAVPDYAAKQRFTYVDGVFDYNTADFNKINGLISMTLYSLALTDTNETATAAVVTEEVPEAADPAVMVAAIAGTYGVDLEPVGWDAFLTVSIEADGAFRADTVIDGFDEFYVQGTVTWADETYTITIPDFSAKLRFTFEDGVLDYNKTDFNKVEGIIRMTLYSLTLEASKEVAEVPDTVQTDASAIDPADMVAAIAGSYTVDLEPVGWAVVVAVTVDNDGELYAITEVEDFGGFYAQGTVTWADGTFTISVPDFNAKLRFTFEDGVFSYNETDFKKILGLIQLTLYSMTAQAEDSIAAIAGLYVIDLFPVGYDAEIVATLATNGKLYAETEIDGIGGFYVDCVVTENNGGYCITVPGYNDIILRFNLTANGFAYNQADFLAIEALLTETAEAYLFHDIVTLTRAAEIAPDEMVAGATGGYIVDLSPIGYDVVIKTWLEPNGYFYVETELEGFGGFWIEGEVTWSEDVYTVSIPDFNAKQRITVSEDGMFDFNQADLNKNEGLVRMMLYSLSLAKETETAEVIETVTEPDPAIYVAALEGNYAISLDELGWDLQILVNISADGNVYAETEIPDLGGFYVKGSITWAADTFTLNIPDHGIRQRFTYTDGVFDYNEADFNKIVGLVKITAYTLATASETPANVVEEAVTEPNPASFIAALTGDYLIDLTDAGWDLQITVRIGNEGVFYAETEIEGFGGLYVEGSVTWADDTYTVNIPDHGIKQRFTFDNGVFDFNKSDFNKVLGYVSMTVYTFLNSGEEITEVVVETADEPDPAEMVAVIAGSYFIDLTDAGWDLLIVATLDEDGEFYAETDIYGIGGFYVEGQVVWAGDTFTVIIPDHGVKQRFTFENGVFDYNKTDYNKIEGMIRLTIHSMFATESGIANGRVFAEGEVPELNPAIVALAGISEFDLSPVGYDLLLTANLWENGYLFVTTDFLSKRFYVEGSVTETDGVFTIAIPDHGVKLRFSLADGAIEFNQGDLNKITGFLRMTIHALTTAGAEEIKSSVANGRVFAEGEVPELNPAIVALSGISEFDLSPVGYNLLLTANLWENGYIFVTTDFLGRRYYVEGSVSEADGVFTIAIPDHGVKLRFSLTDGAIEFNQGDLNKIAGFLRMTIHSMTTAGAEVKKTSASLLSRAAANDLTLPGSFFIDLIKTGWDGVITVTDNQDGTYAVSTTLPEMGSVYVNVTLSELDGVYDLYSPDFDVNLRVTLYDNILYLNETDVFSFSQQSEVIYLEYIIQIVDTVLSASDLAGVYAFDLANLGVPLTIEFAVRPDGSFTASTTASGKSYYLNGQIDTDGDDFALTAPGFPGKLRFKMENGVLLYNEGDMLDIGQSKTVAAFLTAIFTDPVTAQLTGPLTFDVQFFDNIYTFTAEINEDVFTATTVIDGVTYAFQGDVKEKDGVYTLSFPGYNADIRFFTYGDTIYYDKDSLDKVMAYVAIMSMAKYDPSTDIFSAGTNLGDFAPLIGSYTFDFTDWGLPLEVLATINDSGTFDAETVIGGMKYSITGQVELLRNDSCVLTVPGIDAELRLTYKDGVLGYYAEDLLAIGQLPELKSLLSSLDNSEIPSDEIIITDVRPLGGTTILDLEPVGVPVVLTISAVDNDFYIFVRVVDGAVYMEDMLTAVLDRLNDPAASKPDAAAIIDYIMTELTGSEESVSVFIYNTDAFNFTGRYDLDFNSINVPLTVALELHEDGTFWTATEIGGVMYSYIGEIEEQGNGYYTLTAPDFGIRIDFFADYEGLYFDLEDIYALDSVPAIQDLLAELETALAPVILPELPEAGTYFLDLSPAGYDMIMSLWVDENGGLRMADAYDDSLVYGTGYIKNDGGQGVLYVVFDGFGVNIPYSITEGDISVSANDLYAATGLLFKKQTVYIQRIKTGGRNLPDDPVISAINTLAGSYFVDMSAAGYAMNLFFNFFTDGRFIISDSWGLLDIAYVYVEGEILYDLSGLCLSIPEWDIIVPFTVVDGDIALSAQDFSMIMGYTDGSGVCYLERVKSDGRNIPKHEQAQASGAASRDGIYFLDISPAGYDTYLFILLSEEVINITWEDGSLLAQGSLITEDDGRLIISIESLGIYTEVIAISGYLLIDPHELFQLTGIRYDADMIIAEMIVAF